MLKDVLTIALVIIASASMFAAWCGACFLLGKAMAKSISNK